MREPNKDDASGKPIITDTGTMTYACKEERGQAKKISNYLGTKSKFTQEYLYQWLANHPTLA